MSGAEPADDAVKLVLPGGHTVSGSRRALVARAAFFAPLEDDSGASGGSAEWGTQEEFANVVAALPPGACEVLPALLELLGSPGQPAWDTLFREGGLLHVFAAAHFLGAQVVLEAAQEWAAADASRLVSAVSDLSASADAAAIRVALGGGAAGAALDTQSAAKLIHAAAEADAADALRVIAAEEDALGDIVAATNPIETYGLTAPIDLRSGDGYTALHVCAIHNSADAASALLDASASIDALCEPPDDEEDAGEGPCKEAGAGSSVAKAGIRTALHLAAAHDSAEVATLLLERRANVASCVRGRRGAATPLHECAAADAARAARVLAAAAAAASAAPEPWRGEEDSSARGAADTAEEAGPQWARFLDPLQAKVGDLGATPLHRAAEEDAPGVVAVLLKARADANLGDSQGDTPVHCAVLYAAPRALSELLEQGAGAVCENNCGETPLHYLAEFALGESTEDVQGNGKDEHGQEGPSEMMVKRHFARSFRAQEELVNALQRQGQLAAALAHSNPVDGSTPLHAVARWDHLGAAHAAKLLIEGRADLGRKNSEGTTPLQIAERRYGAGGVVAKILRDGAQKAQQAQ